MSHKHDNLIRAIFHDPISGNLQWREVESLLRHLGSSVESLSGTRVRVQAQRPRGHPAPPARRQHARPAGRAAPARISRPRADHAFALRGRQEGVTNRRATSALLGDDELARRSDRATGQAAAAVSASSATIPRRRMTMAATRNVAVLVGSLRKESLNRKMANALIRLAPGRAVAQDRRDRRAAALQRGPRSRSAARRHASSRRRSSKSDAVLFVTPGIQPLDAGRAEERHRRRIAPLRQERVDGQAGRHRQRCLRARSADSAPITTYASRIVFLNMPAMPMPEAYIGSAASLFGPDGAITNDTHARAHDEIPGGFRAVDRPQHGELTWRWIPLPTRSRSRRRASAGRSRSFRTRTRARRR